MKGVFPPVLAALLVLLLISCASGDREPFSESVPEVRDLDSLEAELELVLVALLAENPERYRDFASFESQEAVVLKALFGSSDP